MIDLFSILFSTAMVFIVIVRAIMREAADTRPEGRSHFGALKDRANTFYTDRKS